MLKGKWQWAGRRKWGFVWKEDDSAQKDVWLMKAVTIV